MPVKVLLIPADPKTTLKVVELPADENKCGDFMRSLVGGYFEIIPCPTSEVTIWCNEDGRSMRLPVNLRASVLWRTIWKVPVDTLLGDIFVSGETDDEGGMTSIAQSVIDALEAATKSCSTN